MKPSFKTTTLIAAIGMIVYALYIVARYIINCAYPTAYCFDLWIVIIAMTLLALPIILEAISGLALLCGNEHVLGLKSYSIKTWVKYIAPVLLLSQFIPFRTKLKGIKLKENAIIPN